MEASTPLMPDESVVVAAAAVAAEGRMDSSMA